jgi:hypothetical protein
MRQIFIAVAAALAVWGSVDTAHAQRRDMRLADIQITSLATQVSDENAGFELIDRRMDETGTAGVMFGIVGAVVSSAHTAAQDDATAAPLVPTANSIDLDGLILQAINARLQERGTVPLAESGASHTLLVEIGEWGLVRRAAMPDLAMRTYIKLNVSVLDAEGRRVFGPERYHGIGQLNAPVADFTPDVFRAETEALAAQMGRQVANTIIYR